jgi:hypothetical protein
MLGTSGGPKQLRQGELTCKDRRIGSVMLQLRREVNP